MSRMTEPTSVLARMSIWVSTVGTMCTRSTRTPLAPWSLGASTKSRSRSERVVVRATLAYPTQ